MKFALRGRERLNGMAPRDKNWLTERGKPEPPSGRRDGENYDMQNIRKIRHAGDPEGSARDCQSERRNTTSTENGGSHHEVSERSKPRVLHENRVTQFGVKKGSLEA